MSIIEKIKNFFKSIFGKENVKMLLKDNKELASKLEKQIREYYKIN